MKIGIVGNGGIVQYALACIAQTDITLQALWCRNEEKGKAIIEKYPCTLYTDYQAFLKDDSFDTVYIGLINSLHFQYAMEAIEAHKNVILEKPFTSRYGETLELVEYAEEHGVLLFEAILSRYSKNYDQVIPHLEEIGDLKMIRCNYSQYSSRYDAYLEGKVLPAFDPELSGGALYDINVYNVHFIVGTFGSPRKVQYFANKGPNGIDTSGVLLMEYDGFQCVCTGAKDSASPSGIVLQGTKGYMEFPNRPGIIKDGHIHLNTGEDYSISEDEGDPMVQEFVRIAEVVDQKDTTQAAIWMIRTKQVMSVLDQARVSASIHFAADDDPEYSV